MGNQEAKPVIHRTFTDLKLTALASTLASRAPSTRLPGNKTNAYASYRGKKPGKAI